MRIFKVFKRDRALYCKSYGCEILYTEPNRNKPYFSVFCFEDTEKFRNIYNSYK